MLLVQVGMCCMIIRNIHIESIIIVIILKRINILLTAVTVVVMLTVRRCCLVKYTQCLQIQIVIISIDVVLIKYILICIMLYYR